jgi:hypothetical protein
MLQQQNQTVPQDIVSTCQAVSPMDKPCDAPGTYHCEICSRWFCTVHADDEAWHPCALVQGDEGGEG